MTATADLDRLARSLVQPSGTTSAVAVIEGEPGGRLSKPLDGYPSGLGGRTRFGVAWLVGGLRRSAAAASFDRQDDALRLVHILNGSRRPSTSRSAPVFPAGPLVAADRESDQGRTEVPRDVGISPVCAGCGSPLLPGRRGQRRTTCSKACRVAVLRQRRAIARRADADTGVTPSTPPRASAGHPAARLEESGPPDRPAAAVG
jgi:hypothetical protein